MLAVIGEDSIETLLAHTVPSTIRMAGALDLGEPAIAGVGAQRTARARRQNGRRPA